MIELKHFNGSAGDGMGGRWYACADCGGGNKDTVSNRMYPESETVEYNGSRYCRAHYLWRWRKYQLDQSENPTFESEKG